MAKQPEIETLLVGYNEKHKLNKNFKAIQAKFDEMLSRTTTTDTPNFMEVDYDIADGNITNVSLLELNGLQVVDVNFSGTLTDFYIYKLAMLDCDTEGAILTHDALGDPACLLPTTDGQVLKSGETTVNWADDIDTDTDTVGVTVQEDGVTVATNVTNINWLWTNATFPTLVTTPAGNQVDIALDDVFTATLAPLWEDTRSTDDLNIRPDGPDGQYMDNDAFRTRVDLVDDVGISVPTSDNEYYVIIETSNKTTDSSGPPPAVGTWTNGVEFFDATGSDTVHTGVEISPPVGEANSQQGTTDGGNLLTTYCGIPAGTRYIDFAHADLFLFPLFATGGTVDNRYRAVVSAVGKNAGIESPNSIAYPGGVNTSVTP